MLKGFFIYYLLSRMTGNPLLALIIIIVGYILLDKTYLGFLPDLSAPLRRNGRIRELLSEIAINPANADAAQELGILFFQKKKFGRALDYLKKAEEKVKNSAEIYLYMGMAFMELGKDEPGKTALEKALELDRKSGRGLPYIYLLDYEIAHHGANTQIVKELETEFENFANAENFYRMGMVYKKTGIKKRAKEMFRLALEEYSYVRGSLRRIHRKWAILSRIRMMF